MIDQYGQPIPPLSLIPCELPYDYDELIQCIEADWYDVYISQDTDKTSIYLMVSDLQLAWLDEDYYITWDGQTSEELGGKVVEIVKVNDGLKRWSEEDGFYHV
jgi:hypothetical protein